jgi:hypothetical protein
MAPSLVVTEGQVDEFVCKLARVVESIHSSATFWSEALGLARRVVNICEGQTQGINELSRPRLTPPVQ